MLVVGAVAVPPSPTLQKRQQPASADAAATVDASALATPSVDRTTAPYAPPCSSVELRLHDSYPSAGALEQ
ncbi:hypothetical protein C8R44DRAFT_868576 [Mycena epipterygia]|nr:hypothetical protein C8R44DRAFT_868576 [Mycena epipterygia]